MNVVVGRSTVPRWPADWPAAMAGWLTVRQKSPYCFISGCFLTTVGPARRAGRDRVVRHLGADDRSSTRVRIVDGALRCLARQGVAKTTVDDIARESGLSRATLYRTFPGGREAVLGAVVETEAARLTSALAVVMGEAEDLEDVLVAGMVEAARRLRSHAALAYVLTHEPGVILPHLTFAELDRILLVVGDAAAPFFARWLQPEQASPRPSGRRASCWPTTTNRSLRST